MICLFLIKLNELTFSFKKNKAYAWVGSLSSNICRFHDEFRAGAGRYGTRYMSVDGYHHIG